MLNRSVDELRAIAASGGGFEIDAKGFTTDQMRAIAASGSAKGAQLIIHNSDALGTDDLRAIAASGGGHVLFM
jgi:hypothetical protein